MPKRIPIHRKSRYDKQNFVPLTNFLVVCARLHTHLHTRRPSHVLGAETLTSPHQASLRCLPPVLSGTRHLTFIQTTQLSTDPSDQNKLDRSDKSRTYSFVGTRRVLLYACAARSINTLRKPKHTLYHKSLTSANSCKHNDSFLIASARPLFPYHLSKCYRASLRIRFNCLEHLCRRKAEDEHNQRENCSAVFQLYSLLRRRRDTGAENARLLQSSHPTVYFTGAHNIFMP